jgi:hypothetical protein
MVLGDATVLAAGGKGLSCVDDGIQKRHSLPPGEDTTMMLLRAPCVSP